MANGFPFRTGRYMNRCTPPPPPIAEEKHPVCDENIQHPCQSAVRAVKKYDRDTLLVLAFLLLLSREKVDKKLLLALGYIMM